MLTFGYILGPEHSVEEYDRAVSLSQQHLQRLASFQQEAQTMGGYISLRSDVEQMVQSWQRLVDSLLPQQRTTLNSIPDLHWQISALRTSVAVLEADVAALRSES